MPPQPKRVLGIEITWVREYARTYMPSEGGFSFCDDDLREAGVTLVAIKRILSHGHVVHAAKLDGPGAIWIVEGQDSDENWYHVTIARHFRELGCDVGRSEAVAGRKEPNKDGLRAKMRNREQVGKGITTMTRHERFDGAYIEPRYEVDTLGAPFKVVVLDCVSKKTDQETGKVLTTIPDLVGLIKAVVRSRVTHPRKLNGQELKFIRNALGIKANVVAAFFDMSPEHLSRCGVRREGLLRNQRTTISADDACCVIPSRS